MGYSMTVPFKSAEEKDRMKTFLLANKEILDNLKNNTPYEPPHENTPYVGENLGNPTKKNNFLVIYGSAIPTYLWYVGAWMAVKSEVRDRNNLPYIYYDSEKEIITFDTSDKKNTLVDSEGIRIRQEPDISIPKKVIEMLMGTKKNSKTQPNYLINLIIIGMNILIVFLH
jgi:hypothetical protein